MASVNKVIVVGNLGRDPEVRYRPEGGAVANLSVATTESWKDKEGERQEKTEWHRVVLFGRTAEVAGEYLRKGATVYVEGRLQTRKWQDKDGQDRYTTEIVGDRLQMFGTRRDGDDGAKDAKPAGDGERPAPKSVGRPGDRFADFEDDIPFDGGNRP